MFEKLRGKNVEASLRLAVIGNFVLGAAELAAGFITGNVGIQNDGWHNGIDGLVFAQRERAISEDAVVARRFMLGASTLMLGGAALSSWQAVDNFLINNRPESTTPLALGAAATAAVVNFGMAKKIHSAEHSHEASEAEHHAHRDSRLHAISDTIVSSAYAVALTVQKIYDTAATEIATELVVGAGAGLITFLAGKLLWNNWHRPGQPSEIEA